MKSNYEVFQKLNEFEAMNITGNSIKVLLSDNGGEYLSKTSAIFWPEKH